MNSKKSTHFTAVLLTVLAFLLLSCSQPYSSTDLMESSLSAVKYVSGSYPQWVPGTADPVDGDRFEYIGHLFQAKNNPGKWENPKIDGNWFWDDLGEVEGSVVDTNDTNRSFTPVDPYPANTIPGSVFAPYIDVSKNNLESLSEVHAFTNQKYYTLSFILAGNDGKASWLRFDSNNVDQLSGGAPLDSEFASVAVMNEINSVRASGGEIIISFGGAVGTELASYSGYTTAAQIQAAYQEVIDKYNLTWMDMNLENDNAAPNMDLRMTALKNLQAANPGLKISFQLICLPSGLTYTARQIITKARTAGVDIHSVGIMTMNFGSSYTAKSMGQYSIDAANSTRTQLDQMALSTTKIGICPMVGRNNTYNFFYQADASEVLTFAQNTSWINWIAMWSIHRDQTGGIGLEAQFDCSGVSQTDWDFTNIFKTYYNGGGPTPTPTPTQGTGGSEWLVDTTYVVNDIVTYSGSTYKCLTAHTSISSWTPPNTVTLWQLQ